MSISIRTTQPEDLAAIVRVADAAYADDLLYNASLSNPVTAQQRIELQEWRMTRRAKAMGKPNWFHLHAVDDTTGEIAGYTIWSGPEIEEEVIEDVDAAGKSERPVPPDCLAQSAFEEIGNALSAAGKRVTHGRKDFWCIQALAVHPDHQRRGVGQRLMEAGLKLVDRDGMDCHLAASPEAIQLYRKNGFVRFEEVVLLGGRYTVTTMVRKAKSQ